MGKARIGERPRTIEWNPDIAYAVGLITTDGNLSSDGRHLELTSKDLEQIHNFRRCLNLTNRVCRKGSGFCNKKYYRIQFGDVALYQWLTSIGLHPRKTKTLGTLVIPDEYFMDFLRGCFDGDGHSYSFWDRVFPSSFRLYAGFSSASRPFLLWIQSTVKRLLAIDGPIQRDRGVYVLRYAKRASIVLLSRMYREPSSIRLSRKWRKVREQFANLSH